MSDRSKKAASKGPGRGVWRRLGGRLHLLLAALLAVTLWVMLSTLASRSAFKALFDLTPQAQFTVGSGTAEMLDDLAVNDVTVRIDTFFARIPPGAGPRSQHIVAIRQRVEQLTRDLLSRFVEIASENVELVHYDIYRDPRGVADRIQELGGLREARGVAEDLVVVSVGKRRRLLRPIADFAVIDDPLNRGGTPAPGAEKQPPRLESFVGEEALASAIRSLLVEGQPTVYFLTGLGERSVTAGVGGSYSELIGALQEEGFQIAQLQLDAAGSVPEDAAVVAVMEPSGRFSEPTAQALIRYLEGGGRLFINTAWAQLPEERHNPTFPRLAERLGFRIGSDLVCEARAEPGMQGAMGGGPNSDLLVIQQLGAHPVTRPLAVAGRFPMLRSARPLQRAADGPADVSFEPLLRTGPNAWLAPRDPRDRLAGVDLSLPARRQAFAPRDVAGVYSIRREGERDGQLVLMTGLAFLNAGGFATNGDLALNIFNWLARRDELVAVRGNRFVSRRVEVDRPVLAASRQMLSTWVPLGLLLAALLTVALRLRTSGAWTAFGVVACGSALLMFGVLF